MCEKWITIVGHRQIDGYQQKTYPEDLNTSFPEIVHFQEYMNEPESDVWKSQKGEISENKGTFIALRMF